VGMSPRSKSFQVPTQGWILSRFATFFENNMIGIGMSDYRPRVPSLDSSCRTDLRFDPRFGPCGEANSSPAGRG
jgi:hypothetical protein